jgi:hypothetical protein
MADILPLATVITMTADLCVGKQYQQISRRIPFAPNHMSRIIGLIPASSRHHHVRLGLRFGQEGHGWQTQHVQLQQILHHQEVHFLSHMRYKTTNLFNHLL